VRNLGDAEPYSARFIGVLSRELERRNRAREYLTDAEVQKLMRREPQ